MDPDGPEPNWCACAPSNGFAAEAWFCRARQGRGHCPCCGKRPGAVSIGEGVQVCAGCAGPGHLRDGHGWVPLLAALATREPPPWR